jgi:3-dehydroquinate synthase
MTLIEVALGKRGYDIHILEGLLERAGGHLAPLARDNRLVVVSDETVWAAQGERLSRGLAAWSRCRSSYRPANGARAGRLWPGWRTGCSSWASSGATISSHLAEGVMGDLVGFAAAIVNRGCSFVQIPTTLLAQVDSSVGGKTGINVAVGKNLVGAFHQPAMVLIDPHCLDTLDPRQVRAGYAEIVKYALIEDAGLFGWLEATGTQILAGEPAARHKAIAASIAGKARIVAEDEFETSGRRALLNLGHTFGHAIEAETGFSDRLLHGEAVAVGMVLAYDFSAERGLCSAEDAERVRGHLAAAGLPVSLGAAGVSGGDRLVAHMMHDKKKEGSRLPFILARGIGAAFVDRDVNLVEVAAFLDKHG